MILKGNQRAGGADLATHLLNAFDNDRVELAEIFGGVARDLLGAFTEYETMACGTQCRQPLYSLSINPSAPISREQYRVAINRIEERLGLSGQPRAVVFHVKHAREHCHIVWSRIRKRPLRAVPMNHDHNKLRALARELAHEFGLALPPGLRFDRGPARFTAPPDMTLAEKAQAEETGVTPRQRRAVVTAAFRQSDGAESFRAALAACGYTLARGDRRAFVIVDSFGHIHSLSRYVDGATAKEIRARLAPLAPEHVPEASEIQALAKQKYRADCDNSAPARTTAQRQKAEDRLKAIHEQRRLIADSARQDLLVRQAAERMTLHAAQLSEITALARQRAASDAKPLSLIMARVPGYAAVVRYLRRRQDKALAATHEQQRQSLARRHILESLDNDRAFRFLHKLETRERRSLEKHFARIERLQARETKIAARQAEFAETAREVTRLASPDTPQKAGKTTDTRARHGRNDNARRRASYRLER